MATDYGEVGRAFVRLFADRKGLQADLDKAEGDVAKTLDKIGGRFEKAGKAWSAAVTAPIVAAVGVAIASLNELDKANQRIVAGTGAIGAKLREIKKDFVAVLGAADDPVRDVASAITQLYQRTGQTGAGLQELTNQVLNLGDVSEENGVAMVGTLTRVFGDWSIATDKQSAALDTLYTAFQLTGTGIGRIAELIVQFGGPLRQMGFSFEQAIAMMAKWEKEGVNTELVAGAMRIALGKLAEAGIKDVPAAFTTMIQAIKDAGTAGEANSLALQFFGAKAGPDMAAAVREGRFEIAELVKQLNATPASINDAANATQTFGQFMGQFKNQVIAAFAPLSENWEKLKPTFQAVADAISGALAAIVKAFVALPASAQVTIIALVAAAAAVGPLLLGIGALITALPVLVTMLGVGAEAFAAVAVPVVAVIAVIGALRGAWMLFGRDITRIMKGLVAGTADGFNAIAREAANFSSGFLRGFASLWSAVGSIFETGVKAAAAAIGWLYDQYNKVVNAVAGWIAGVEIPKDLQNGQAGFFNEMKAGIAAVVETSKGIDFVTGRLEDNTAAQRDANTEGAKGADEAARHAMNLDELTAALSRNKDGADKAKDAAEKLRKEREAMAKAEQDLMDSEAKRMRQEMDQTFDRATGVREQAKPELGILRQLQEALDLAREFPRVITPEVKALLTGELLMSFQASAATAFEKAALAGDPLRQFLESLRTPVETLIMEIGELDPVMGDAAKKVAEVQKKAKIQETWKGAFDQISKVGSALASLPGAAGKVGQVMVSVSNIAKSALEAMAGNWLAIIDLIIEAIQLLGIFGGKNKEEAKGMQKIMDDLGDAVEDWGKQLTDVLVEFVKTGKASFKDLADSIISDILRITIQAAIVEPLIKFGKNALGFAKGGAFVGGQVYKAATGAIVTRRTGFVGPMGLGIAGEGGGHGEAILPLAEVGGKMGVNAVGMGGGGDTYITVNNNTPAQVRSNSYVDASGAKQVVIDIVNEGIATGAFDRSGGGAYNWQRQGFGG